MKHGHFIALGAIFLSHCSTTLRDGWSLYVDGSLGKHGASALFSLRKEIPGGQESWYWIPFASWDDKRVGSINGHGVSNSFP